MFGPPIGVMSETIINYTCNTFKTSCPVPAAISHHLVIEPIFEYIIEPQIIKYLFQNTHIPKKFDLGCTTTSIIFALSSSYAISQINDNIILKSVASYIGSVIGEEIYAIFSFFDYIEN